MSSQFLQKFEEEKKQAKNGQMIDDQMAEDNEEDEEDFDMDEKQAPRFKDTNEQQDEDLEKGELNDKIQDLEGVQDSISSLSVTFKNSSSSISILDNSETNNPIKAIHKFHVPQTQGMGGIPKSKVGAQPFVNQSSKYDPSSWEEFYDSREMLDGKIPVYYAGSQGHVFFCLHGAGHSAQSFACLAKILKQGQFNSTCVSFDFRGHGKHYSENDSDMSQQTLINETIHVLKHIALKYPLQSIIVVGHSMGGSIATKTVQYITTNNQNEEWAEHIKGLFIIDVVEGSAMDALPFMESIVKSRPSKFNSLQDVVKYGVSSNTVRDIKSAKVSMPAQVVEQNNEKGQKIYVWRTDLLASKQYWTEWFKGLTQTFLGLKIPKQLLLAASDRMDQELTIAHMQGRFKMVVIDNVGHVIQEDRPEAVANVFQQFLEKFRIPSAFKEQMVVTTISGKKVVINQ